MAIINVKQASDHLRLGIDFGTDFVPEDFDIEDYPTETNLPELIDKMAQAEAIILDYLKVGNLSPAWEPATERDETVVRSAILLILGSLWNEREDQSGIEVRGADMLAPNGVVARLLARLRDPAMA